MNDNVEYVTDYMTTKLITFSPDLDIKKAIKILLDKKISGAPVVDSEGHLVGMLSEKDCIHLLVDGNYNQRPSGQGLVSNFMCKDVRTIKSTTTINDLAYKFTHTHYRRFPVVRDGKLLGQISRRDVLKAILKRRPKVDHVPSSWKPRVPMN